MVGITRKLSWVILLQLDKEVVSLFIHKRCWSLCSTFPIVLNTSQRRWVGETSQRKCSHLGLMLLHLVVKGPSLKTMVFYRLWASDVWCFTRWNTWQYLLWCHWQKHLRSWRLACVATLGLFFITHKLHYQPIHTWVAGKDDGYHELRKGANDQWNVTKSYYQKVSFTCFCISSTGGDSLTKKNN